MITFKKIPIIKAGQMMYMKDDPEKKPYKVNIWSATELFIEDYDFCNKKEAKYKYVIEFNWRITF